jgi:NAD(P)-dependent dehydrogenase (short-subunit alcohol dehydrogenase family)
MAPEHQMRFDDKVAIVTGAGRGLGRAYALLLAARGAAVVVNDFDQGDESTGWASTARQVAQEIRQEGGQAVADLHNVSEEPAAVVASAINEWGQVDIVVNNAGVVGEKPFELPDEGQHRRIIETDLYGSIGMTAEAWPQLIKQGGGAVVNISSTGMFGSENPVYGAVKSAVFGLTRNLSLVGESHGIRVNSVMPLALSPMAAASPDSWKGKVISEHFSPDQVAPFVVFLAHPDCRVNGECFSVGGGRAARVLLAVTAGVLHRSPVPEAYRSCVDQLMTTEDLHLPKHGIEELQFALLELGIEP